MQDTSLLVQSVCCGRCNALCGVLVRGKNKQKDVLQSNRGKNRGGNLESNVPQHREPISSSLRLMQDWSTFSLWVHNLTVLQIIDCQFWLSSRMVSNMLLHVLHSVCLAFFLLKYDMIWFNIRYIILMLLWTCNVNHLFGVFLEQTHALFHICWTKVNFELVAILFFF